MICRIIEFARVIAILCFHAGRDVKVSSVQSVVFLISKSSSFDQIGSVDSELIRSSFL